MQFSTRIIVSIALTALLGGGIPCRAAAAVLTADTRWEGEISLTEDVLVPAGVTLTIAPGTSIRVGSTESSKTDPEYLSSLVEVTVRGAIRAEGSPQAPISFSASVPRKQSSWGGILIDGGDASIRSCRIESSETAVHLLDGTLVLKDCNLAQNRYGLVLQGKEGTVQGSGNLITANDYGLVIANGSLDNPAIAKVIGNRKKDIHRMALRPYRVADKSVRGTVKQPAARTYGDDVLLGETVWRERVVVNGTIRVPEGSRLVILPGTVVEFGERDSNGDGIGENGMLIQGVIVAKGTSAAPIIFRSAGDKPHRGGWDAINIMNSAGAWNLIEHCSIQDAYRGLHFHFSRVAVTNSSFDNNYRGIQFQEATVLIRNNRFFNNKSAVQGRDSDVTFNENWVYDNLHGINFFRTGLTASRNRIIANVREGVRLREGATVLEENLIDGNRYGLLVMDAVHGAFRRNCISSNGEFGCSVKNSDNLLFSGNFVSGNGISGMNIVETGGRISGNLFSDNGEHGIGVQSFSGAVEENNFIGNGRYAIDVDGSEGIAAPRNWWGGAEPDTVIFDQQDDPEKGKADHAFSATAPFLFAWPLAVLDTSLIWRGDIAIDTTVSVTPGVTLTVAPATHVRFARGTGLVVKGKIVAAGERERRIYFSSLDTKDAAAWDEILLERADGSSFSQCIFENATWGLHSHFTSLKVDSCLFRNNTGGLRFRSGPVQIGKSIFADNSVGIRSFRGNATITDSTITRNGIGIFVREKGGGLSIRGNDIYSNTDYNIRLGDFNDEDVDAAANWWGSDHPEATIQDGRNEPGIGLVRYEPFLRKPGRMGGGE